MLSEEDEKRINAAVAEAERQTAGEIFCILTQRTSRYAETPLAYAAVGALLIPLGLVALGLHPWAFGWSTGEVGPEAAVMAYTLLQAVVFLAVLAITWVPAVRLRVAPEPLKRSRVRRAAMQQFLAKGLHQTKGRTGVLIFASLDERRAEVIADEAVYNKVDKDVWGEALDALVDGMKRGDPSGGFVDAVRLCGEVLARHFPPTAENPNELPDQVVVL